MHVPENSIEARARQSDGAFLEQRLRTHVDQDIVDRTGVHRGSLYDTFGDKNQFFLSCLRRSGKNPLTG